MLTLNLRAVNPKTVQETPYNLRTLIRYETGLSPDSDYGFEVVYIDEITGFMYETADSDMAVGQVVMCEDGELEFQYYV